MVLLCTAEASTTEEPDAECGLQSYVVLVSQSHMTTERAKAKRHITFSVIGWISLKL